MSDTEFETKVPNVNPSEIIAKLHKLKAEEIGDLFLRRYMYDMSGSDIQFIRLRTDGQKTTLTYKYKVLGNTIVGKTTEIEVEVADFDRTAAIFSKLEFKNVVYQENKSHIFKLNDIEFSIDTWPKLNPYLEVESHNIKKVIEGLQLLGLEGQDIGDVDILDLYKPLGLNPNSQSEWKFD